MANIIDKDEILKRPMSYQKLSSLGQCLATNQFYLSVIGENNIRFLVETYLPPISKRREPIRTYGPLGVQFVQQGSICHDWQCELNFMETIKGEQLKFIYDWVQNNKEYKCIFLKEENRIVLHLDSCFLKIKSNTYKDVLVRPQGILYAYID